MKYLIIIISMLLTSCLTSNPEPETITKTETIITTDTMYVELLVPDTIQTLDTILIVNGEVVTIMDTLFITRFDTFSVYDTIEVVDTVGSFGIIDTIYVPKEVTLYDTVVLVDTVTSVDTVTQLDTVVNVDTVVVNLERKNKLYYAQEFKDRITEICNPDQSNDCQNSLTDPRSGNVYGIMLVGKNLWMTSKLQPLLDEDRTWMAVMTPRENGRDVCPVDWRIPTVSEMNNAISNLNNIHLGGFKFNSFGSAHLWSSTLDQSCTDIETCKTAKYMDFIEVGEGFWIVTEGHIRIDLKDVRCIWTGEYL